MTEEQRKSNMDFMVLYMTGIIGVFVTYFAAFTGSIMTDRHFALIAGMGAVIES